MNVFTPRDGNDKNNAFIIMGLEPWEDDAEGVLVRIFNRWATLSTRTQVQKRQPLVRRRRCRWGVLLHHLAAQRL